MTGETLRYARCTGYSGRTVSCGDCSVRAE